MKKNKLSRAGIASLVLCVLAIAAFFLPLSTGSAMTDLSLKYAFNIVDVVKIIFNPPLNMNGITGSPLKFGGSITAIPDASSSLANATAYSFIDLYEVANVSFICSTSYL